ncbi:DHA2 family efflux MFS transporter permease subunit [Stenoxybacter acetivorans]|uniref:DHA2 family efflux MFS transporter permease subunit n=1 Tax=Stenoxybacter acetivorans TaxID=422441 RepID=UPI00056D8D28|nr:DHA2 family efflux MFS transporter permease subunit [Stenoxybacter acetivorans]
MKHSPLSGVPLILVTLALSLAVFMQVLDTTIANVALPTIAGNLGAATSQGTWVITSFAVANAISVPLTGWLARRFGEVRVFVGATLLFVLTSLLCGIAPSLGFLVVFRILQGAVAGPMIPLSQSLLMAAYPPEKRSMALALWSMTIVVAPIVGPILGGIISDNWHWGWIFFINIPVGLTAAWVSWRQLKHRETERVIQPIDGIGLALMVLGVGALQMMLDLGEDADWFSSTEIVVLAVVSAVCLSYFVIWEWGEKHPIVDLQLFRDRNFSVGVITTSAAFMVYMGAVVLLPLVLQTQLGYTATWAGLATAPIGIFPILLSPIIGKFGNRLDMRVLVTFSFTIYASCFFWRSEFTAQTDFMSVFWPQFCQGLGVAMFFMPLTTITLSHMAGHQIASAAGISNFVRILAGGIGTSIITNMWDNREALHHSRLVEAVTPYNDTAQQTLKGLNNIGLNGAQQAGYLDKIIAQQSHIMGSNDVFWLCGIVFLILIVLVWFAKPPFGTKSSKGGGAH